MGNKKSRFVNDSFMLFRVSLRNDKIKIADENVRESFIKLLSYYLKDMDFSQNSSLYLFLNSYAEHLNLKNLNFLDYKNDLTEKELNDHIKMIKKLHRIEVNGELLKYKFKMFFLFTLFFIRYLLTITFTSRKRDVNFSLDNDSINYAVECFKLNKKEKQLISDYLDILNNVDSSDSEDLMNDFLKKMKHSYLLESSENLINNIKYIMKYHSLPIYNVGIFATMSAGKSTFVNALLDKDFIPSKNEACTAKITSISDNDSMDYKIFGGCSLDNKKNYMFSNNITNEVLENWNNDNKIDHIFLEADIKNIHSQNGILVIHDTPGPNNSRTEEHGLITKEFLEHNKDIDLFVYLINAEHATTEDNYDFMETIHEFFVKRKEAKIIFLLNKIDSFDTDKADDINVVINNVREEIEKAGFKDPMIIPISANGARLFKKALHKEEMSKKEIKDFKFLFSLFNEEEVMDLPSYCNKDILEMSYNQGYSLNEDLGSEELINVDGENYNKRDLLKVLDRTSINLVRSLLDKEING